MKIVIKPKDRDKFLAKYYPNRKGGDIPGGYDISDDDGNYQGYIGVRCGEITVYD